MNEVKVSNVAPMPANSASAQTRNGKVAASQTEVPNGKEVPESKPQIAVESKVVEQKVVEQKTNPTEHFDKQQEQLEDAVSKLNDYVQSTQRDLEFSFDEEAGRAVVTVLDRETQKIVRRIPEEVVLNLAHNLESSEPIRLFSAQA